jgi:MFS family permease
VIRRALGEGALARAQASFAAAFTAEWAFTVGIGLVAFRDGGAEAVGLVAVLRLLPAAVLAPVLGGLGDRLPRERVLIASSLVRGGTTLAAAAALAADAPVAIVYVLAVVSTIAFTPFRAAHSALVPSLCRTTEDLTMATVIRGTLDSLSVMTGPVIAALLVSVSGVWAVFAFAGATAMVSAALLAGLRYERPATVSAPGGTRIVAAMLEGLRATRSAPGLALIVGLTALQTAIRGALTVFVLVVAIDLLDLGQAGVGWLQGAMGVGALAGSVAARRLVGSRAMARWLGIGVVLWGVPLTLLGTLPSALVAFVALAVIGVGNAIVDVSAFSTPGRMVPDAVLARVYGLLESLIAVAVASGALLAPPAIDLLGVEGALVAFGLIAPTCVALAWSRLTSIDHGLGVRADDIGVLRKVPMLRPLPVPVIEQLARNLDRVELPAGAEVFAAGDGGDRFFVIEHGRVDVLDGRTTIRTMTAGEGFGEIALLHDVPRTMTVTAADDVVLRTISRADFLPAVTGFDEARSAATAAVTRHLSRAPGAS